MDNEKLLEWFIDKGICKNYALYIIKCINIYERNYKPCTSIETVKFRRPYEGIFEPERVNYE
jgi:hypothetical protein